MIDHRPYAALGGHDLGWLRPRTPGGGVIEHQLPPGRGAYLVTTTGRVTVNGLTLAARDGAGLVDEDVITIATLEDTEIVLAELG